jgi:F-type H+-transporting ATPase subunit delta
MSTADRTARGQSYALAFYEAVMERSLATLQTISARLGEDPSLVERLQAADVDFSERQPLLEGVFPAETDAPVRNLVYTLMQRGDLGLLGEVAESLHQRMRRAETAAVAVEVTSAVALTDEQRAALVSKFEAQYGAGLEIHYRVDPAILGGLIVRVGDKLTDGSLATRMAAMRQALGLATGES